MKRSLIQTWNEAKKNPVFTLLYIGGVAFAIAFIMVYAIMYYVRAAPIYPEYDRTRTAKINSVTVADFKMKSINSINGLFATKHLSDMDGVDLMAITSTSSGYAKSTINPKECPVRIKSVTPEFFRLFAYEFLEGKPFDDTETGSDKKIAIITDRMAQYLFGDAEGALGKEFIYNDVPYRVAGVVRQASTLASDSYSQLFFPHKLQPGNKNEDDISLSMGGDEVLFRLKSGYNADNLQSQIDEITARMLLTDSLNKPEEERYKEFSIGPMVDCTKAALGPLVKDRTWYNIIKQHLMVLVVLLIIPALNISGMIGAQMDRKNAEIGIRRSFGATKGAITRQVMLENLYLTIAGGIVGLICAWIFIWCAKGWIFDLLSNRFYMIGVQSVDLSGDMLFAPGVFIIAFAVCLALNMISAYIPVRWTLRKQVVNYINDNK